MKPVSDSISHPLFGPNQDQTPATDYLKAGGGREDHFELCLGRSLRLAAKDFSDQVGPSQVAMLWLQALLGEPLEVSRLRQQEGFIEGCNVESLDELVVNPQPQR